MLNLSKLHKNLETIADEMLEYCIHSEFDNSDAHDHFNNNCTLYETIEGVEAWSFSDGSAVSRDSELDCYWTSLDK